MQVFFNSDGTSVTAVITIVSDGAHVDPDSWPISNDPAIVLSSHPSATKTVTAIDTGVYKVVWTGLSPALSHGDIVFIAVDGAIDSTAWTTWQVPIQVLLLPAVTGDVSGLSSQTSVDTINTKIGTITDINSDGATVGDNLVSIYNRANDAANDCQQIEGIVSEVANLTAWSGTVVDPGETATVLEFDTSIGFPDGSFVGQPITITEFSTAIGQTRIIKSYTNEGGHIVLATPLTFAPLDGYTFKIWSRAAVSAQQVDILTDTGTTIPETLSGLVTQDNLNSAFSATSRGDAN